MYPILRTLYYSQVGKRKPKLEHPFQESVINMRVLPSDIDIFMELNNGRYLTLMDIARTEFGERVNLPAIIKRKKWGLMVGAVSTRYRRRLRPFEKFSIHTKLIYFDNRWFYFHQRFLGKDGKLHASFLVRTAIISKQGIVAPEEFVAETNYDPAVIAEFNKPIPWLTKWVESDELHKELVEHKK